MIVRIGKFLGALALGVVLVPVVIAGAILTEVEDVWQRFKRWGRRGDGDESGCELPPRFGGWRRG